MFYLGLVQSTDTELVKASTLIKQHFQKHELYIKTNYQF